MDFDPIDLSITRKTDGNFGNVSAGVLSDIKGQRVAHIAQVTCFEIIVRTRRLFYPNFLFARRVVEMIVLPQRIVSLCEAMYQIAFFFLALNFG